MELIVTKDIKYAISTKLKLKDKVQIVYIDNNPKEEYEEVFIVCREDQVDKYLN